jgi:hypothetical protein
MNDPKPPIDDSPPFARHRTYYIVLKYVIIAAAVVLALYVFGLVGT